MVVLVVVTVDDVLVVVTVDDVVVAVLKVAVVLEEVTVNVGVWEVAVNVCVVCVGGRTTCWSPGPSESSHITSRGTARLTQTHHGTQAQNQGIGGLGTGTVSNWPPCPTYFHSLTCSQLPRPPPT